MCSLYVNGRQRLEFEGCRVQLPQSVEIVAPIEATDDVDAIWKSHSLVSSQTL